MSDLMEDFFDTEFYDSAIEKSLDKQISRLGKSVL